MEFNSAKLFWAWDTSGYESKSKASGLGPAVLLSVLFLSLMPALAGAYEAVDATPAWLTEGGQLYSYYGWSVAGAGDVNGDGYSDVIVGAYGYNHGQYDEGRAFVFHGGPSGLSLTYAWTGESDQYGALFGWDVSTAGDINGDGYDDIIVSAHYYDNTYTEEGRVYAFHGGPSGVSATPAWIVDSNQERARFGCWIGSAGDVNGDGYADVIVGSLDYDNGEENEGRAFVYHGGPSGLSTTPDWTAENNQAFSLFGYSVAGAGDVNGDGYSDVIVGARRYQNGQQNEGRAYAFHGGPSGLSTTPDWIVESNQLGALFGNSVAGAGDVNGDGYSDVIVGAPYYLNGQSEEGCAFVYHGGPSGLSTTAAWTAESDQVRAHLGWECAGAGDVNGDGYSDVIVGAREYDGQAVDGGKAYLYLGGSSGLYEFPTWTAEGDNAGMNFGKCVGSAGDVDGDGDADVIVGAYRYTGDLTEEGAAFVYLGNPVGLGISKIGLGTLCALLAALCALAVRRRTLTLKTSP